MFLNFKPRGQWHTFWNADSAPARILEIISPAGFEGLFAELAQATASGEPIEPAALAVAAVRYGLEFDFASLPRLCQQYGVTFLPGAP